MPLFFSFSVAILCKGLCCIRKKVASITARALSAGTDWVPAPTLLPPAGPPQLPTSSSGPGPHPPGLLCRVSASPHSGQQQILQVLVPTRWNPGLGGLPALAEQPRLVHASGRKTARASRRPGLQSTMSRWAGWTGPAQWCIAKPSDVRGLSEAMQSLLTLVH